MNEALPPIARYKIGYHADEWGQRSSTPGGIPDHAGSWVRYADHVAALVEAQQPAPSADALLRAAQPATGPTWAALNHAWHKIGCDAAGMDWGAFTNAVHYAPSPQAAQQAPVQSGLVATMLDALRHAQKVLNHNNLHLECGPVNAAILAARAPADSVTAPAGGVVAYLDIGAGGYLDLGTDLSNEAISRLPKGRHALIVAGTYGIDGYTPTPPTQVADSVQEAAARWFTVVYRGISAGDEARALCEHPKASAMSWSHAIRDRDAARAAQKEGSK